jgi:hypothetical protein
VVAPRFRRENGGGYIDPNGRFTINQQFHSAGEVSDDLGLVLAGGKIRYISRNGKYAVNPRFGRAGEVFARLGTSRVQVTGTGTLISTGNWSSICSDQAGDFNHGLARSGWAAGRATLNRGGKYVWLST